MLIYPHVNVSRLYWFPLHSLSLSLQFDGNLTFKPVIDLCSVTLRGCFNCSLAQFDV